MEKATKPGPDGENSIDESHSAGNPAPLTSDEIDESRVNEARLVRKLDFYLIPWLTLLYLIAFLDRTNIGNATLYDLEPDLRISPNQYYVALTLFFIPYSLFEPLTNILLKLLRPKWFISAIVTLWGIVMTCTGLVHDFQGLATTRFFLGLAEAGLFPGVNFLLACWYKRSEFGVRAAIFFSAAALAGSFGGLLAVALAQMDGIGGKSGWSWIFIIEGLATVLVGIASIWMVHDFPSEAQFLSDDERLLALKRLSDDKQASSVKEEFNIEYLWEALRDWKTYAFAIVYMGCDGPLYAFSLFLPSIISELGTYSHTKSNLLSVPPYAVAAVLTVAIGFIADKTKQRGLCNIACALLGMTGFAMLLGSTSASVKYAGVYLGALGIYPCIANTIAWASNNVEGVYKRGIVVGIVIGWGNLNGVVSSNIYRSENAPHYYLGHGVVLAYLTLFLFCGSIVTRLLLHRENNKRMRGERKNLLTDKSEQQIRIAGDKRPDFIYTL